MTSLPEIVSALGGRLYGNRGVAYCPSHDDGNRPSLSVAERDGKILVHCFAGCTQSEVLDALRERGLWPEPERRPRPYARPVDPAFGADLNNARYWQYSVLAVADQMLAAMRTTDPDRRAVTRYSDRIRQSTDLDLVALYREHRRDDARMVGAMVAVARNYEAELHRRLATWIVGWNGGLDAAS